MAQVASALVWKFPVAGAETGAMAADVLRGLVSG